MEKKIIIILCSIVLVGIVKTMTLEHEHICHKQMISSEEMLFLLDVLMEEIPYFIEKYKLGVELPWKEWGKKYGFYAALGICSLGLRIYIHCKKKRERALYYAQNQNGSREVLEVYDRYDDGRFVGSGKLL